LAWVSSHDLNTSSCRKEKLDIVPLCRWGNICQGSITKLWLEQSGFSDSWCSLEPNWAEDTSPWDIEPILFSRPWASADLGRSKCHEPQLPMASLPADSSVTSFFVSCIFVSCSGTASHCELFKGCVCVPVTPIAQWLACGRYLDFVNVQLNDLLSKMTCRPMLLSELWEFAHVKRLMQTQLVFSNPCLLLNPFLPQLK
jgi:hypothetical protein